MKVIAGRYKGTTISVKSPIDIRPTTNRIKEWVFQILDDFIVGANFLDLFSGSGNMGIEALSRNCKSAVFIDKSTKKLLEKNLNKFESTNNTKIFKLDVLDFLKRKFHDSFRFDLVYADPPYKYDCYNDLCELVMQSSIIENNALFILETGKNSSNILEVPNLVLVREKNFGDTIIKIFRKEIN